MRVETQVAGLQENYVQLRESISNVKSELGIVSERLLTRLDSTSGSIRAELLKSLDEAQKRNSDERHDVIARIDTLTSMIASRASSPLPELGDLMRKQWVAIILLVLFVAQSVGFDLAPVAKIAASMP